MQKLTGRAISATADIAISLAKETERSVEGAAAQRAASAAFAETLRALRPPVTADSGWREVSAQLAAAPPPPRSSSRAPVATLDEAGQRAVFDAYVGTLRQAREAGRKAAAAGFRDLLLEAEAKLAAGSGAPLASLSFEAFSTRWGNDPRFKRAGSDGQRRMAFRAYTEEAAAAMAAAAARKAERESAEADFRQLMAEQEALVASGLGWVQLRRSLWADARYDRVPERRRRELFGEYCAVLKDAGVMGSGGGRGSGSGGSSNRSSPGAGAAAASNSGSGGGVIEQGEVSGDTKSEGREENADLLYLRAEQERLKAEYDR